MKYKILNIIFIIIMVVLLGECTSNPKHVTAITYDGDSAKIEVSHFFSLYKTHYMVPNHDTIVGIVQTKYDGMNVQVSDGNQIHWVESSKIFNNFEIGDSITLIRTYVPNKNKIIKKYEVIDTTTTK